MVLNQRMNLCLCLSSLQGICQSWRRVFPFVNKLNPSSVIFIISGVWWRIVLKLIGRRCGPLTSRFSMLLSMVGCLGRTPGLVLIRRQMLFRGYCVLLVRILSKIPSSPIMLLTHVLSFSLSVAIYLQNMPPRVLPIPTAVLTACGGSTTVPHMPKWIAGRSRTNVDTPSTSHIQSISSVYCQNTFTWIGLHGKQCLCWYLIYQANIDYSDGSELTEENRPNTFGVFRIRTLKYCGIRPFSMGSLDSTNYTSTDTVLSACTVNHLSKDASFNIIITVHIVSTAGIVGNMLALWVISRYRNKISMDIILVTLATADMLYLCFSELVFYNGHTHFLCHLCSCASQCACVRHGKRIIMTISRVFWGYGVWITVYLSVDRYIAIARPFLAIKLCAPRVVMRNLLILFLLMILYLIGHSIWLYWQPNMHTRVRTAVSESIFFFIPQVLTCVFNVLLVYIMVQSRRRLQGMTSVVQRQQAAVETNVQLAPTIKVVAVVALFALTHGTYRILVYLAEHGLVETNSYYIGSVYLATTFNSSLNPVLYYFTGRKFRRQCIAHSCSCLKWAF